jgi:hypothetical protein
VRVLLDLGNESYRILQIHNVAGQFSSAPISQIAQGLEDASLLSAAATHALAGRQPRIGPSQANVRATLFVLVGMLASMAVIAFLAKQAEERGKASPQTIAVPEGGFRPVDDRRSR